MKTVIVLVLALVAPLAARANTPSPWDFYVAGRYEDAIRAGEKTRTGEGYLVAARAAELTSLQNKGDRDAFDAKVRQYQGYP